jgi:phage tail-like protein
VRLRARDRRFFFSGTFQYVAGLGSETVTVIPGIDDAASQAKIPGRLKWGPIELKRGITQSMDLYEWRKLVETGNLDEARKDGSITMLNTGGSPVATYSIIQAWPSKYTGVSTGQSAPCVWEWVTLEVDSVTRLR